MAEARAFPRYGESLALPLQRRIEDLFPSGYASAMKEHPLPPNERDAQKFRVRRIVGQLKAIERMLEEDRECSEILMQLVSARKALKSLAETLIHSHVSHCIQSARTEMEGKKQLRDLLAVLRRYVE
jgi:DNA-binding FrmR family transcriptional regulator